MEIYAVKTDKCFAFDYDYDNSMQETTYYKSKEKAVEVFKKLVKNQVGNRMWYPYCMEDYTSDNETYKKYEDEGKRMLEKSLADFLSGTKNEAHDTFLPDIGREYYTVTIKRVTVIE